MTNDRLEGRVLFWARCEGQITVDVLATPAASPAAAPAAPDAPDAPDALKPDPVATPISLHGSVPWSPLGAAIVTTLERWADRGEPIRLEPRTGRDGGSRLLMASDRTWLVVDLIGVEGMAGDWSRPAPDIREGVTLR